MATADDNAARPAGRRPLGLEPRGQAVCTSEAGAAQLEGEGGCYANDTAAEIPSPWGPLVAKTDHSPEQSPRNGRCHSSLSAAVAWRASLAARSWVRVFRPLSAPSPPGLHLRERSGDLGPSLEQGRPLIGLEHSTNTSAASPWGERGVCWGVQGGGVGHGFRVSLCWVSASPSQQPHPPSSLALTRSSRASSQSLPRAKWGKLVVEWRRQALIR